MKHITLIVPDGQSNLSTVTCIVGACEILAEANAYWKKLGRKEPYKVALAGTSKKVNYHDGAVSVCPQINVADIARTDLIIIPASAIRSYSNAAKGNRQQIDWIEQQYRQGAEVASMCSGAFMLASTGLLTDRACSTHWAYADSFRSIFPQVDLRQDSLITDEHGIYTNGGGYSFLNLMLYLVEKYYDRQTAIFISKMFQIEIDRQSQSAFIIFSAQKNHDDDIIRNAQAYIETNLHQKISVEELSTRFSVGRRHFDRRFIRATGNTPLEYLQRVRIESAKKAFETTRKNVNEVMYEVGYSDVKAFREVFRKITGLSPLHYRNKYNGEAEVV
ncbi:MAG: helix-turn-helix domain-containing protein [Bacteroidota bacterium]